MGYRHHIAIINKDKLEELRNKVYSKEELDWKAQSFSCKRYYDIEGNCEYSYELGKLYFERTNDIYNELYKEKEDLIEDEDMEMFICPQNIFETLAKVYLKLAKTYFEKLFKPFKKELQEGKDIFENLTEEKKMAIRNILDEVNDKIYYLNIGFKYNEGKRGIDINNLYEHNAFNLMHIHKTIDFENQVVICYAG